MNLNMTFLQELLYRFIAGIEIGNEYHELKPEILLKLTSSELELLKKIVNDIEQQKIVSVESEV